MFRNAIVRVPAENFAEGLTTAAAALGVPDYSKALAQHARYCDALRECGIAVTTLAADARFPDSTFVEDTAVLTERGAILTRPGAESRRGETGAIVDTVKRFFQNVVEIVAPGTVDGGDICQAENHFFLGLSERTNEEGLRQFGRHLSALGYNYDVIDIQKMPGILHLKSALAYLGNQTMVTMEDMKENRLLREFDRVCVAADDSYAANCVRVNERLLVTSLRLAERLTARGFHPLVLDMSEFQKMDGGLSCLSLRF